MQLASRACSSWISHILWTWQDFSYSMDMFYGQAGHAAGKLLDFSRSHAEFHIFSSLNSFFLVLNSSFCSPLCLQAQLELQQQQEAMQAEKQAAKERELAERWEVCEHDTKPAVHVCRSRLSF